LCKELSPKVERGFRLSPLEETYGLHRFFMSTESRKEKENRLVKIRITFKEMDA